MRHEQFSHGNAIAFEVEAGFIEGEDCACALCRPHSALVAFASRDGLSVDKPAGQTHHFNRQRLTHAYSHVETSAAAATHPFAAIPADGIFRRKAG